jgi:hypothetical protein
VSGKSHNAKGRTSLALQGDSVEVCTNQKIGTPDSSSMALDGCLSRPSPNSDGSLSIERLNSRNSNRANCVKSLLPDPSSRDSSHGQQPFYTIQELAVRWRCSRGTVYNRLRFAGAKVLDFASAGKKGKKLVPALTIFQIESKHLKALP